MTLRPDAKKFTLWVLVACAIGFPLRTSTRATGCPATHGQYTNVLCNGDDLAGTGAYLVTGDVRLSMSGGSIDAYNGATFIRTFFQGTGDHGDPSRIRGLGNYFEVWNRFDEVLAHIQTETLDSNGYMKLLSDGCLYHVKSDDTFNTGVCVVQ